MFACLTEAPTITADRLYALQSSDARKDSFVLVDVRSNAETDVSIIPGAITKTEFEQNRDRYRGKTVVAYCTVGYRSGIYTNKLRLMGWSARNYKGSILDWCANQLPIVTKEGIETQRVHTYNANYKVAEGYRPVF